MYMYLIWSTKNDLKNIILNSCGQVWTRTHAHGDKNVYGCEDLKKNLFPHKILNCDSTIHNPLWCNHASTLYAFKENQFKPCATLSQVFFKFDQSQVCCLMWVNFVKNKMKRNDATSMARDLENNRRSTCLQKIIF